MNTESKYRRKLVDLVKAVESFTDALPLETAATLMTNDTYWELSKEAQTIKSQLENEELFKSLYHKPVLTKLETQPEGFIR